MNTNEKCLLNYLSDYSMPSFKATEKLINFLSAHNRKIEFNTENPVYKILDEIEFLGEMNYNFGYEQENLD